MTNTKQLHTDGTAATFASVVVRSAVVAAPPALSASPGALTATNELISKRQRDVYGRSHFYAAGYATKPLWHVDDLSCMNAYCKFHRFSHRV